MKVILLDDATWELAKRKLLAELDCARTNVQLGKAWERHYSYQKAKWWGMKWARKRRLEAEHLARKILCQAEQKSVTEAPSRSGAQIGP